MRHRFRTGTLVLVFSLLLGAHASFAQIAASQLTGTVKDSQGGSLPGVTVTAVSPSLIGTQSSVSESSGVYRFPSLPPGAYTLKFELQGFQTALRPNIVLTLGQTISIDMQLQLSSVRETITVTAVSPVVDVQSTALGSNLNETALQSVPSSTNVAGSLAQAAGIRMLGFDVGGGHKSQSTGTEAYGVRSQGRLSTEGIDTTDGGGQGSYEDFFAQQEVTVTAAGSDVSMNTPGLSYASTVKSGGNQFKGLYNFTYEPSTFVGDNVDATTSARGYTGQPNLLFWEAHLDFGGPVLKDRLWFYAAYNHFKIDKQISGIPRSLATDIGLFDAATGKATYKASHNDTFIGYYQWHLKNKPLRGISATVPVASALGQYSPIWLYNAQYQRVWSNRLFTTVMVGNWGYDWPEKPVTDFHTAPPRQDLGTGAFSGAGWSGGGTGGPFEFFRSKPQVFANATYYLPSKFGEHDFKFGYEWLDDDAQQADNGASGPILYRDLNSKPSEVRLTDVGTVSTFPAEWAGNDNHNRQIAAYLQDRFKVSSHVTLTLGVRFDHQRPYYTASSRQPVLTEVFSPLTVPARTLLTSDKFVPRLGVSWDPRGDGKSIVKAFYGRYYSMYYSSLAGLNPGGTNFRDYTFLNKSGNGLYHGVQDLGPLTGSGGGTSTTLDPGLKTPHTDEADLSYQVQVWGESSLRFAYVRKMSRDPFATINVARLGQFTSPFTTTVNLQDFDSGITGVRTFQLYDIPAALKGVVTNQVTNIPDGAYNYDTVEAAFHKRFGGGLFVDTSVDYQFRNELRTPVGLSTNPLNSDPVAVDFFLNPYPAVSNRQTSRTWQARMSGRYEFRYQIGVGANLQVLSGWPYTRVITVSLPNAGALPFFADNLTQYSDAVPQLSFRIDKALTIGPMKFTVMADVFNALNVNVATNFNLSNGSRYNQINAALDPRTLQVGLRFQF